MIVCHRYSCISLCDFTQSYIANDCQVEFYLCCQLRVFFLEYHPVSFFHGLQCECVLLCVQFLSEMKSDQARVCKLLTDTVVLLCKNGLMYSQEMKVQGLLGITVDKNEVFLVHTNELIAANVGEHSTAARKKNTVAGGLNDQERVSKLLTETVTLLCKNGLVYSQEMQVQGLLGITVDRHEVLLVQINELIAGHASVPSKEQFIPIASSEPAARKKNAVACTSTVVDLTRMADSPRPVQQSMSSSVPPGQLAARRRHRLPPPAAMMIPQQQMSPRMQYGLRPRMSGSPLRGVPASQFASNYLAQAQLQQVARGMSPVGMGALPRQRPVKQRTQELMSTQTSSSVDDDVVIIGTGHEEPSPSWSSPIRKRPLPSMSSSPASLQKRLPVASRMSSQGSAARGSPTVIDQLSSAEVAGTLELSADDVPTSIKDMIMEIAPSAVTTPKKQSCKAEMLPELCTAAMTTANNEASLMSTEDCVVLTQPDAADINSTLAANDTSQPATITQPHSTDHKLETATESLEPLVYTDIACGVVSNISGAVDSFVIYVIVFFVQCSARHYVFCSS